MERNHHTVKSTSKARRAAATAMAASIIVGMGATTSFADEQVQDADLAPEQAVDEQAPEQPAADAETLEEPAAAEVVEEPAPEPQAEGQEGQSEEAAAPKVQEEEVEPAAEVEEAAPAGEEAPEAAPATEQAPAATAPQPAPAAGKPQAAPTAAATTSEMTVEGVQAILDRYSNNTTDECSPAFSFAGDAGTDWEYMAQSYAQLYDNIRFIASGDSSWITVTVETCLAGIVPEAPTFSDNDGQGDSITIPSQEGVAYRINGEDVDAGTYPVAYDQSPQVTVTVSAYATGDTELSGLTEWTQVFDGRTTVAPAAVEASDAPGTDGDVYTIPSIEGVEYLVDGVAAEAGSYQVPLSAYDQATEEARIVITARPASEWYRFADGDEVTSEHVFTLRTLIEAPVAPQFNELDGRDNDTIVIPDVEGASYTLNGQDIAPGTYAVADVIGYGDNDLALAVVTVTAAEGYRLPSGAQVEYRAEFDSRLIAEAPQAPAVDDVDGYEFDTVTLPVTKGVDYLIDGQVVTGTVNVGQLAGGLYEVTVVAQPQDGYKILPEDATSFTVQLDSRWTAGEIAPATSVDAPGHEGDTFTVPQIDGIVFTLDGQVIEAGEYPFDVAMYDAETEEARVELVAQLADNYKAAEGVDIRDYDQVVTATLRTSVEAPAPTADDVSGGERDTYEVPDVAGVVFTDADGEVVEPGLYLVTEYDADGYAVIALTATADEGYRLLLDGEVVDEVAYELRFDAFVEVEPSAPQFTDEDGAANDTYTIPETEGVEYLVDGEVVAAGTYAGEGTVTITARALPGYKLAGDVEWTFTFDPSEAQVEEDEVQTTPSGQDDDGTVTVTPVHEQGSADTGQGSLPDTGAPVGLAAGLVLALTGLGGAVTAGAARLRRTR